MDPKVPQCNTNFQIDTKKVENCIRRQFRQQHKSRVLRQHIAQQKLSEIKKPITIEYLLSHYIDHINIEPLGGSSESLSNQFIAVQSMPEGSCEGCELAQCE